MKFPKITITKNQKTEAVHDAGIFATAFITEWAASSYALTWVALGSAAVVAVKIAAQKIFPKQLVTVEADLVKVLEKR